MEVVLPKRSVTLEGRRHDQKATGDIREQGVGQDRALAYLYAAICIHMLMLWTSLRHVYRRVMNAHKLCTLRIQVGMYNVGSE
jgi:hypothetical protein